MTNPAGKLSMLMSSPKDAPASQFNGVVQQTEGSKAYVLIDGGTSVWCDAMDVKAIDGDRVRVDVRKHKGTLIANYTHPVTDDAVANVANGKATEALEKVNTLEVDALKADSAVIKDLQADTAKVHDLTADQLSATTAYVGELTAGEVTAASIIADKAKLAQVDTDQLTADHAVIESLDATYASIGSLNAATARIGDIEADYLKTADMEAERARVGELVAGKADVADLTAANGRIDNLESTKADISYLEAEYITADAIDTTYLHADMSNADVAWIQNGTIKDGSISNAMINSLSANKLTAGTINGETINVTNINADNITTGTINGQRIGEGSLSLDKLSEDVYTEKEVDDKLASMQAEIDGAIETWTGTAAPTLNNSPASDWKTSDERDRHVGDVYFVVNSQSQQNGYNYRFTKSGSTYSWQLIKDSDVTNALQRLSTAEGKITTFDSDISKLKTDTGTLTTKTESLETRMSDAEDDILDKVDTTTFNEVSDTVDQHSQSITQMSQTLSNKADGSTVTALTNRVSKTEQDITGVNTTIGELQTTVESKADGSTVEGVSNRLNTVSDTVDGHTQSISSINSTLETKADSSTVSSLTTKVNTVSDTVEGHTQTIGSVQSAQTTMQGKLDKTVVETTQLWYSKAGTDAPAKPTSQVTSTSTNGNAWRVVVPAYNSSCPNYFYCWQWKYTDGTYGWSGVTRDIATGESQERARTAITNAAAADTKAGNAATAAATAQSTAEGAASDASKAKTDAAAAVSTANTAASDASTALSTANTANTNADTAISTANTAASDASTAKTNAATAVSTANTAKATADKNVKSSLQLWFTKANETAPNKPTSKVTSTSLSGNGWRTVVPTYSASYPYYFYCMQYELADGTYTWSDVVYDRATTENQSNSRSAVSGVSTLTTKTNTISDTVDGHTSKLNSITETQTTIQGSAVKSTVQLWFTKANTTAPSKPTAHVTTNDASKGNQWNLAVPTYNASYPYYYYCYEHQLLNDTYTWSAVTRDMATEEMQERARTAITNAAAADTKAVSAQNTANKNVRESQQLWYTKANSTAPSKPTSKVTSTATSGGAWTTRVPTYSDSYKHYFYCMQYVAADNTVTWSDVIYDQATTEAQSIARAASADLTEFHQEYATFKQTTQQFESTVGETYATKNELKTTDDKIENLEIGGRNLLYNTADWSKWAKTSKATESGEVLTCTNTDTSAFQRANGWFTLDKSDLLNREIVVSFDAMKTDATDLGTLCFQLFTTSAAPKSVTSGNIAEGTRFFTALSSTPTNATIENAGNINSSTWARVSVKFIPSKVLTGNYTDMAYLAVYVGIRNVVGSAQFRRIKAEFGNRATDWTPAPEDVEASVSSIEERVSTAETSITNNSREIGLRAKATDVYTKTESDGLISTEVTNRNAAIKESADAISLTVSKISSVKYVNVTAASWPLASLKIYAAEGHSEGWNVNSTDGLRVGDTVYVKGTDGTRSCTVYIKTTVTSIENATHFTGTSHGYEDVLPVDTIKSTINQSSDSVKIQAKHVEIDGEAIFSNTAFRQAADNAYDSKGSASAVQTNLDNLEIGGRNLLINTGSYATWDGYTASSSSYITRYDDCIKFTIPSSANWWTLEPHEAYIPLSNWDMSATYTVSIDVKFDNYKSKPSYPILSLLAVSNNTTVGYPARVTESMNAIVPTTNDWTHFEFAISGDYTTWTSKGSATVAYIKVVIWLYLNSNNADAVSFRNLKLEKGNKATDWSPAPEDVAASAVKRTQRIWYRKEVAGAPATPSSWVAKADDGSNAWTKMHVSITDTEKFIYTCEQYEMGDGTVGYTSVLLDNTITVIDGGNIITGTVTSNKLNASDINASKVLTVGAMTDAAASTILNSNVQVGGRNLLPWTGQGESYYARNAVDRRWMFMTIYGTNVVDGNAVTFTKNNSGLTNNTSGIRVSAMLASGAAATTADSVSLSFGLDLKVGDALTFSCDVKTTGNRVALHAQYYNGITRWTDAGSITEYGAPADTEWHRYSHTFTVASNYVSLTALGIYCELTEGVTISARNFKLEKGNKATDWSPAPEDVAASAVKRTQRIWYRKEVAGAPATPSSWVAKADDGSNAWTKMHVSITDTEKFIYTCEQYEMGDGTVGYTSVLLDNTITVIDGGNIITGSVTANQIAAGTITSEEIAGGTITSDNIAAGAISADRLDANALTLGNIEGLEDRLDAIDSGLSSISNETQWVHYDPDKGTVFGENGSANNLLVTGDGIDFNTDEGRAAWATGGVFHANEMEAETVEAQTIVMGDWALVQSGTSFYIDYIG